ncbi:MAG TPA: phospho-N-acetylmuramoyl-pentapeptide-transferase [Candidatus Saccharimonadales bacterium]|jgi:phospho-N-acetylmuramoyl-pentapeptide-transferase|nr:phospho-N-acetylmuramoyl-pentapeptide-transferase [Candidatus Saccharimonadales bacterium]
MLISPHIIHQISIILLESFLTFCVAMTLTPLYTTFAYRYKWWKRRRTHSTTGETLTVINKLSTRKRDVPTMAALITVVSVAAVTFIFNLDRRQTWLPLAALLGAGAVGIIDDIINVRGKGGGVAGLRAPIKFTMVTIVAAVAGWWFVSKLGFDAIHLPVFGDWHLGWWLIPLFTLVVVSSANAVNISDGLDGLAGGLMISAYFAFGVIAAFQGNFGIAAFCMAVVGALLSYVWFNIPPARFFMGDIGSFALGTALGVIAMLTNTLALLPVIGLVFVIEAGSSLLQIVSKKAFHRKIFIAAPIHHHLEAKGWPKTKVTMRFWILGQVCAALGVILALTGGYIR